MWYAHHKLGKSEPLSKNVPSDLPQPQLKHQVEKQSHNSPKKVNMQWVGEALEKGKIKATQDQVHLFEDILWRSEVLSKEDLACFTEDEFLHHIVELYKDELMPLARRKKFESLYACVAKNNVRGGSSDQLSDQLSNSSLLSQRELEEKMLYLQKEMDKCRNVNLNDVASKKKVDSLQRKLDAVFQSTVVGHGNQVSDAVATKQGATISIVNPTADEQMSELRLMLMQLQEEFDSFRLESEKNAEKQAESKKKKN